MTLHVDTAGAGPDLVLLHGWGLHSGAWAEVFPALQSRYRVHAIDLPGHGYSAGVAARSFDDAVEMVAPLVPVGARVCGWSLGGMFAQRLAHRHPARVSRLALVASTPCFEARPGWAHGMKAATLTTFAEALANDPIVMLKRFVALNAMHGPHGRETVRAFMARLKERGPPSEAGLAAGLGWLRESDLRAETAALRLPTVVMHGGRDMLAPVDAARWLAAHIAGAKLVEVPEAAHMPFFSHRDKFLQALEGAFG
jgi:pimeloyl-[acyl-carrier protein] methyl ester esterase